jgi:hypothetical protein
VQNKYSKPEAHIGKNDESDRQNQANQIALEVPIKFSVQKGEYRAAIVIYKQTYRRSSQEV